MAHELSYIIVEGRLVDAAAKLTSLQMKRPLLWHMQHMNKGGLASYIRQRDKERTPLVCREKVTKVLTAKDH
jgi:hypothetical protein